MVVSYYQAMYHIGFQGHLKVEGQCQTLVIYTNMGKIITLGFPKLAILARILLSMVHNKVNAEMPMMQLYRSNQGDLEVKGQCQIRDFYTKINKTIKSGFP